MVATVTNAPRRILHFQGTTFRHFFVPADQTSTEKDRKKYPAFIIEKITDITRNSTPRAHYYQNEENVFSLHFS